MTKQTVTLNYLRMAPRKVRAVAGLMRGLQVSDAEAQLLYERRRAAKPLLKLLRSAVSAAKSTKKLNPDHLVIEGITVDQATMLRRSLPRARGVATMIQKKMSHVTLTLIDKPDVSPRFTIIIKKKAKKTEGEEKSRRRVKPKDDGSTPTPQTKEKQKSGFFHRVFRRKSV